MAARMHKAPRVQRPFVSTYIMDTDPNITSNDVSDILAVIRIRLPPHETQVEALTPILFTATSTSERFVAYTAICARRTQVVTVRAIHITMSENKWVNVHIPGSFPPNAHSNPSSNMTS